MDVETVTTSDHSLLRAVRSTLTGADEAFLWTSAGGLVNLQDYLMAHGVANLSGWDLKAAFGVSSDGRTIVGYGKNPNFQTEAWIATVPEPGSLVLAVLGAAGFSIASRLCRQKRTR